MTPKKEAAEILPEPERSTSNGHPRNLSAAPKVALQNQSGTVST
jgi:hypothetical protein